MIQTARQLWFLLSKSERRRSVLLGLLLLVNSLVEMSGVISIVPLVTTMTSAADPCSRLGQAVATVCSQVLPSNNPPMLALLAFGLIATSNLLAFASTWMSARLTWTVWRRLSASILAAYMEKPYEFFFERHSSSAIKNIVYETERLAGSLFMPMFIVISRLIVTFGIALLIVLVDPVLSLAVIVILAGIYYIVYRQLHEKIKHSGDLAFQSREQISRIATDAIAGIRELRMLDCSLYFSKIFRLAVDALARQYVYGIAVSILPRYIIETAAMATMLGLAGYLSLTEGGWHSAAPLLAFYFFAAYRLLPQFQQIFANSIIIQQNSNVAVALSDLVSPVFPTDSTEPLVRTGRELGAPIVLENVSFIYPGSMRPVLVKASMEIPRCLTVGLVGVTGAGKSTVLDLIAGLIQPTDGRIIVNGMVLDTDLAATWRARIGYVPQVPFILDDTIRRNIAFGLSDGDISQEHIDFATRMANLREFIDNLRDGLDTLVGERGIRLSGGQRQRLAIARALYRNPEVLIFDEATNSLDQETEQAVMDAIRTLSHKKTMFLISHRPATLKDCDLVYQIANGKVTILQEEEKFLGQ